VSLSASRAKHQLGGVRSAQTLGKNKIFMTPEQVHSAINAVLADKIVLSWWQFAVVVLLSGIAAYCGAYLKKKGENLASAEDMRRLTEKVEEIKSSYTMQIEDYKAQLTRRTQAAKVAQFLTEWISPKPDFVRLNGYAMELSFWLPHEIYQKLARCICHEAGAPTPKEILIDIRKYLLKDEAGELKPENIIHFDIQK
jgi:hypothetical protein